jgi:arginase family enzyme
LTWTAINVPLDSSGTGRGEERAPDALMAAGLLERMRVGAVIETDARVRSTDRDRRTGVIGARQVREASMAVAAAVRHVLTGRGMPLVIGGDCTLLLGVFLGTAPGTRLWFVDGHADFLDGKTSSSGEAADMELATLTGHGPPGLLPGPDALVEPSGVVLLGHRPNELDPDVARENARIDRQIFALTAVEIRSRGARSIGEHIAAKQPHTPVWLHIDLDVLDEKALSAVTYPQPLGLDWQELIELIHPLGTAPQLAGVSVADYNPDLDKGGEQARRIVDALEVALT